MKWGRLAGFAGDVRTIPTIAISGTTLLEIPEGSNDFIVTGAATPVISSIGASGRVYPGRIVTFYASGATAVVFTNTSDTTTKGLMALGKADKTLVATDTLTIKQTNTGAWLMLCSSDNSA